MALQLGAFQFAGQCSLLIWPILPVTRSKLIGIPTRKRTRSTRCLSAVCQALSIFTFSQRRELDAPLIPVRQLPAQKQAIALTGKLRFYNPQAK
jgi:hypothetical protein